MIKNSIPHQIAFANWNRNGKKCLIKGFMVFLGMYNFYMDLLWTFQGFWLESWDRVVGNVWQKNKLHLDKWSPKRFPLRQTGVEKTHPNSYKEKSN
jgi:hypothetical protein